MSNCEECDGVGQCTVCWVGYVIESGLCVSEDDGDDDDDEDEDEDIDLFGFNV